MSYSADDAGLELALSESAEDGDGVLHITDACITLEIPTIDGVPSVLAWDPAEVSWDAVGLAAS